MSAPKRLREHAALFAALLGVVALVCGLNAGIVGMLSHAATEGVRDGLTVRSGADLGLRMGLNLDGDAETQDREVRAVLADVFRTGDRPLLRSVDRSVRSTVDLRLPGAGPTDTRRVVMWSLPDLPERAELVDGVWGSGPAEATLQADAAARLDVAVGDTVLLSGAEVEVVGTWRILDALDPRWLGESVVTDGVDAVGQLDVGPFIVDESVWGDIEAKPIATWTLVPDAAHLTADDLQAIADRWTSLGLYLDDGVASSVSDLKKQGRFLTTTRELGARVDALRAIEPVVLLLLAAIAAVTLAELARLLTTTRAPEISLLWSRGASALDLARGTAAEVAAVAGVGALLGTGAAVAVLAAGGSSNVLGEVGAALVVVPISAVVAAVAIVAGSTYRSARRQTLRDPGDSDGGGRGRRLAGPGIVVLLGAAAALAVWQLRLYGSPVTPDAEGDTSIDPIAVLAPALALVAVVITGLVLFPVLAGAGERLMRRGTAPGVARLLATRTVARRVAMVAAPIVVVAVAAANLVVAAGYAGTWSDSFERTAQLRAGSSVLVQAGAPGLSAEVVDEIAALDGVDAAAPVEIENLSLGSTTTSLVAVDPDGLAVTATDASGVFDPAEAAESIRIDLRTPVIPAGTESIAIGTSTLDFAATPQLQVRVTDLLGVQRIVPLDLVDADGDGRGDDGVDAGGRDLATYTGELPTASVGDSQLFAVEVAIPSDAVTGDTQATFGFESLTATSGGVDTEIELDQSWLSDAPELFFSAPIPDLSNRRFTIIADTRSVRMTPTLDDAVTDQTSPPVIVSRALAEQFGLDVGDTLSFALQAAPDTVRATVVGIVPVVPGATEDVAVMMDLGLIQHYQLRQLTRPEQPKRLWVSADDPDRAVDDIRPLLPANSRYQTALDSSSRAVLGSAATALWAGAGGCALLAIVTVAAATGAQLRSRRPDAAVLRALGIGSRAQAGIRRLELATVVGYGLVLGLVAGAAVTALTVAQLARAAVPESYTSVPTALRVDGVGLAVGLAALAVALAVLIVLHTAQVAAQVRATVGAEESR